MTTFDDFYRSAAYGALYREYYEEIRDIVKAARKDAVEYSSDFDDLLWEAIDGHVWVIYTAKARLVEIISDSDPAEFLDDLDIKGATPEQRAFACMMIDAREAADSDEEDDEATT